MKIKGILVEVFETQTVKETFRKREFVVEVQENPQYPEYIKLEAIQDKCDMLDQYTVGSDEVTVDFNLKGRAWVNAQGVKQYFNTLQAWKISGVAVRQPQQNNVAGQAAPAPNQNAKGADDDMPF